MPYTINKIARIENDFEEKFGIPRQSGLAQVRSKIVFEPEYRVPEAFRGIEGYSYLWLIWGFSETRTERWSPTVRPPVLGGNTRMGVFASRSPYRPNSLGLSSVALEKLEHTCDGPVLYVSGADLMNGTPIYDIKPYLAYTDSHPDASGGYSDNGSEGLLEVRIDDTLLERLPPHSREKLSSLSAILSHDPRPRYQRQPDRLYTMSFGGMEVSFRVEDGTAFVENVLCREK